MKQFPGFSVETTAEGIYIIRGHGMSREAVDAFFEQDAVQSQAAAATTGHVMRCYIVEKVLFPTPYFLAKANDAVANTPAGLYESSAFVLTTKMVYSAFSAFLNRRLNPRSESVFRVHKDLESALAFLRQRHLSVMQAAGEMTNEPA